MNICDYCGEEIDGAPVELPAACGDRPFTFCNENHLNKATEAMNRALKMLGHPEI